MFNWFNFLWSSLVIDVDNEGMAGDGKRMRGITTCSSEGPVSLDDVRRLQRSNEVITRHVIFEMYLSM